MNLNILKNLLVYSFTLSVCKMYTLQSEKTEERCISTHASYAVVPVSSWTDPPPPPPPPLPLPENVLYGWPLITIK